MSTLIDLIVAIWEMIVATWEIGWIGRVFLLVLAGYIRVLIRWVRHGGWIHG